MKVLVATDTGQGDLPNDYCWTTEGELVHLLDCPDPLCSCAAAFGGFESLRATTTAVVVERSDLDVTTLVAACKQRWARQGYADLLSEDEIDEAVLAEVFALIGLLRAVDVGTVVERAGDGLRARYKAA